MEDNNVNERQFGLLRSLTRLTIGGLLVGADLLKEQLRDWEQAVDQEVSAGSTGELEGIDPLPEVLPPPQAYESHQEPTIERASLALAGLVFETQERIERGLGRLVRVSGKFNQVISPFVHSFGASRLMKPVKKRFDQLVARGQDEVARWVQTGRTELGHSRQLVKIATTETVDASLEYLSQSEDVMELVQEQSTGLASEVIEEMRERTVSGDNLLESVVRSLFRRTPREHVPPPPLEVREGAIRKRPIEG
jgi:hypothetical protein